MIANKGHNAILAAAINAHRLGSMGEAEAHYREVLKLEPADPDALHFLGLLRFQHRQTVEGERLIRLSLSHAPRNPHAWNNLGNVLFATNRLDQAADAYLNSVEIDLE